MFPGFQKTLAAAFLGALTIAIIRGCHGDPAPKTPEPPELVEVRAAFQAWQRDNPANSSSTPSGSRLESAERGVRQWIRDAEGRKDAAALRELRLHLKDELKVFDDGRGAHGPNGRILIILNNLYEESVSASQRVK